MLSDEQMSNEWAFSLLNDEQMSNKVGVEHQPVIIFHSFHSPFGEVFHIPWTPLNPIDSSWELCHRNRISEGTWVEDKPLAQNGGYSVKLILRSVFFPGIFIFAGKPEGIRWFLIVLAFFELISGFLFKMWSNQKFFLLSRGPRICT